MWMSPKTVRIIAIIFVILFLLSVIVSFASAEEISNEANSTTISFSLEQAKEYAREHNYDLQIAKLDKADAELNRKINDNLEDKLKDTYQYTKESDTFDIYKARNGYAVLATKNAKKLTELANTLKEKATEVSVETAYYKLSEKSMIYDLKKKTLDQISEQVKIAEKKLELGTLSDVAYKGILIQKMSAEMDLKNADTELFKARMEFNGVLNLPLEQQVTLTSKVEYSSYQMPKYDDKLLQLKNEDVSYVQLILDKDLIELERKLTGAYKGTSDNSYKLVVNKGAKNNLNIMKKEIDLEYKLKANIKTIQTTEEGIKTAIEATALNKVILEITKLRNNLGMATDLEVIDSELKLQDSEIKYVQAVHGYNTLVIMFDKNIIG